MINRYFSCESVTAVNELRERIETQTMASAFGKVAGEVRSSESFECNIETAVTNITSIVNAAMNTIVANMTSSNSRIAELEAEND